MPITRTAMIDDDGSGTTGTIFNNAWKQELYGQIDAMVFNTIHLGTAHATGTLTGDQADYRPPNGEQCAVWLLQASAPTNLFGFLAEPHLTEHLIINSANQPLYFHNQHGSSAAANRFITPGYAANYLLGTWGSVRVIYLSGFNAWVIQKAT